MLRMQLARGAVRQLERGAACLSRQGGNCTASIRSAILIIMPHPLGRISIDPANCFGKPCIKGTRIWISAILDLLAEGTTKAAILADYPRLTIADVGSAITATSELARKRIVPVPSAAAE